MTKEKIISLTKYQAQLKDKLSSTTVPTKHVNRVASYKRFLTSELEAVTKQLDAAKMEGVK